MKKNSLIIVAFIGLIFGVVVSCTNNTSNNEIDKAKKTLEIEAEIADKQLAGKKIDAISKCISCNFDGENMVYTYEIDENSISIDKLSEIKETMEKNLKNQLSENTQFAITKENLIKVGGTVIFNYVGSKSKKVMTITIVLQ